MSRFPETANHTAQVEPQVEDIRNVVEEPDNQPSTSNGQPEQISSTYADTLLQISPLPKAVIVPGARKRKSAGSEVITSSPYKKALMEKQLQKKPVNKGKTTNSRNAKTQHPGNTVGGQKCSLKVADIPKKSCKTVTKRRPRQHVTGAAEKAVSKSSGSAADAASELEDDETIETVTVDNKCIRSKRTRKQRFSLAEAVRAIAADSSSDDSDVEL